MFIALYAISLALAAGLTGCYAHAVLAGQGYIASFQGAVLLTIGVAGLFAALQLAFITLLNLVAPTRSGAPLLMESISNGASVVLLPYLLHIPISWPHEKLQEFEVLVLLGIFGAVHVGVKLFSLFAALYARPTFRLIAIPWLAAAALCAVVGGLSLQIFAHGLRHHRVAELPPLEDAAVDLVHAQARPIQEGAVFRVPLEGGAGKPLLFHLAWPEGSTRADKAYVSIESDGSFAQTYNQVVTFSATGWTALRVTGLPADATYCDLIWMTEQEPEWMTRTGIRPVALGSEQLLFAGPRFIDPAAQAKSIVLVMADGIGTRHTSLAEYPRATTPKLQAWAQRGVGYFACISPSPETPATMMTLLTGLSPLRHGYLNGATGSLPDTQPTLPQLLSGKGYINAAFTEAESTAGARAADRDCAHGDGFERGFDLFDQGFPMTPGVEVDGKPIPGSFVPAGSAATLERAQEFITAHKDIPFFVLIRLRELTAPRLLPGATGGFVENAGAAKPVDVYDSALQRLDETLGGFLEWLDNEVPQERLCVAVTSPFGYDFNAAPNEKTPVFLNEASLRVPLWIKTSGAAARTQRSPVSLEDLGPTLANVAGVRFPDGGLDLLGSGGGKDPISVTGDPIALSLRSRHWRFTMQTGVDLRTRQPMADTEVVEFVNIDDYDRGRPVLDQWGKETRLADQYRQRLMDYVKSQVAVAPATGTAP